MLEKALQQASSVKIDNILHTYILVCMKIKEDYEGKCNEGEFYDNTEYIIDFKNKYFTCDITVYSDGRLVVTDAVLWNKSDDKEIYFYTDYSFDEAQPEVTEPGISDIDQFGF